MLYKISSEPPSKKIKYSVDSLDTYGKTRFSIGNVAQMTRVKGRVVGIVAICATILCLNNGIAMAEPRHGIAMNGDLALEKGFSALPYANPDAPKGGKLVFGESGGFDSLNPFILKGRAPWGIRAHVFESLLGRNYDEAFSLYGLLAETVETGPNRDWVEFTLRPEAQFSDGSPVTVEDVLWSFETLGTVGHRRYTNAWEKIATATQTGPRSVRFTFKVKDRELPLILGLRPVLRKADWQGRDFTDSGLQVPTGSGPYVIDKMEANRYITFKRDPNYWGRDLGFNAGRHNFDEIRYDYFFDQSVIFEAFKAGEISTYREGNAEKWKNGYDFPAILSGEVIKAEIPHARPSGMKGLVMNTRRAIFADWRVRAALIHAFNFEFINQALNGGGEIRRSSYFSNSTLGMEAGAATGQVRALLEPFAAELLPGAVEGYTLPVSNGSERNRGNLRKALRLFKQAGWAVKDGIMQNAAGTPFEFEVLLKSSAREQEAITSIYIDALKRLGIKAYVTPVDNVQYFERKKSYDFDVIFNAWFLSLSPGNEQMLYWGSKGVTALGTRNYMGMNSPAAEAMINEMLNATESKDFTAAVKALDRILTSGRYVIPIWYGATSRLAHRAEFRYPEKLPLYGDWSGFLPDVWWYEE